MNRLADGLMADLRRMGIPCRYVVAGKHGRIYITVNGLERFIVTSLTSSDRRAHLNARSNVRRMIRSLQEKTNARAS